MVLRLGNLHLLMAHQNSLGTRMEGTGFEEHSLTADLISPKSLERALSGKDYNRATALHLIWFEVIYGLLIESFFIELSDLDKILLNRMRYEELMNDFESNLSYIIQKFNCHVSKLVKNSATAALWISYLKEVQIEIIIEFTTSSDRLQWERHLEAIFEALGSFFAFDQFNYARSGSEMYADMVNLQYTHPLVILFSLLLLI